MADSIKMNVYGRLTFVSDKNGTNVLIHGDGNGKKSCKLLVPKAGGAPQGCASVDELKQAIVGIAKKKFGDQVNLGALKLGLKDGDKSLHSQTGQPYAGHAGHWALAIGTKFAYAAVMKPPGSNTVLIPQEQLESKLYSGAWVIVNIEIKAYDFPDDKTGMRVKGVYSYLQSLLWVKDDDALGGGKADPNSAFEGIAGFEYKDPAPDASGFGDTGTQQQAQGGYGGNDAFFGGDAQGGNGGAPVEDDLPF